MRALWLGPAIAALGAFVAGSAAADGYIVKRSDPYVYVAPDAMPIVYDWTGFYIGGHLGAATAENELAFNDTLGFLGPESFTDNRVTFAGGGHIGLQKQWSWIVVGAEVAWTHMDKAEFVRDVLGPDRTISSASNSVLAVTGKFGWAWDNILAYFKGGYATTEIEQSTRITSAGTLLVSSKGWEPGWTAGAGIEWAVWRHAIFGIEYNYTKFNVDHHLPAGPIPLIPFGTRLDDGGIDIQSVTARLSFKFGGVRPEPVAII
jgi:outer membrane immunogenic protein